MSRITWTCIALLCITYSVSPFSMANKLSLADAKVSLSETPDWVNKQVVELPDQATLRTPSHYHLVDYQEITFPIQQSYSRYSLTLTDPSAVESNSNVRIRFSADYQELQIHEINVLRNGKKVNSLSMDDIQLITAEDEQDSNIYSGEVDALVMLENVRPGDVLDYSYTQIGSNPIFKNKFSFFSNLAWNVQVDQLNIMITTPLQRPLQYKVTGSSLSVKESIDAETRTYSLTASNTVDIYEDDATPSWYSPYPFVQFSEYDNWLDVSAWAAELFDYNPQLSPELQDYIAELQGLNKEQAIIAAINFTQDNVRYLGLEIGQNSHLPRNPNDVFDKRYGDCKDKSLLLSVILRQLDVDANVALVSTREKHKVSDYLPTQGIFNHAIVKFNYADKAYWVDPTITHQSNNLATLHQPSYGQALLVKKGQVLSAAQSDNTLAPAVNVDEQIIAGDFVSPVEWVITTRYYGDEARRMRYKLQTESKRQLAKNFINYYAKSYPNIQALSPLQATDDRQNNVVTLVEHYLNPDYWDVDESDNANFSLEPSYIYDFVSLPQSIVRSDPLAINGPISISHKVTLQFPFDVDFSEETQTKVFENDAIMYRYDLQYDYRKLSVKIDYQSKLESVPRDKVAEHIALLRQINDYSGYFSSVTNATSASGSKDMQELLNMLNKKRITLTSQGL